jgi:hypothetical protein
MVGHKRKLEEVDKPDIWSLLQMDMKKVKKMFNYPLAPYPQKYLLTDYSDHCGIVSVLQLCFVKQ